MLKAQTRRVRGTTLEGAASDSAHSNGMESNESHSFPSELGISTSHRNHRYDGLQCYRDMQLRTVRESLSHPAAAAPAAPAPSSPSAPRLALYPATARARCRAWGPLHLLPTTRTAAPAPPAVAPRPHRRLPASSQETSARLPLKMGPLPSLRRMHHTQGPLPPASRSRLRQHARRRTRGSKALPCAPRECSARPGSPAAAAGPTAAAPAAAARTPRRPPPGRPTGRPCGATARARPAPRTPERRKTQRSHTKHGCQLVAPAQSR